MVKRETISKKDGQGLHDFEGIEDAYEAYADAMNVSAGNDTITLIFGTRAVPGLPAKARVVLRVNPIFARRLIDVLDPMVKRIVTPVAKGQKGRASNGSKSK